MARYKIEFCGKEFVIEHDNLVFSCDRQAKHDIYEDPTYADLKQFSLYIQLKYDLKQRIQFLLEDCYNNLQQMFREKQMFNITVSIYSNSLEDYIVLFNEPITDARFRKSTDAIKDFVNVDNMYVSLCLYQDINYINQNKNEV